MKIEKGKMVVKGKKAWGVIYEDGKSTEYGWVAMEDGKIYTYIKKPIEATYPGSPYINELLTGKLVYIERAIKVSILGPVLV